MVCILPISTEVDNEYMKLTRIYLKAYTQRIYRCFYQTFLSFISTYQNLDPETDKVSKIKQKVTQRQNKKKTAYYERIIQC